MLRSELLGCELRSEQVEANRQQATEINSDIAPEWIAGDSSVKLDEAPDADFIFSCPPYSNLEKYSDDERDLSNMNHADFLLAYRGIIKKAMSKLRDDRFACFVVADYRDKKSGNMRNFVGETVQAFEDAGGSFYNSAILRTPTGSAGIRAERIFGSNRKLISVHQNVLVFCKGNAEQAAAKAKRVEGQE